MGERLLRGLCVVVILTSFAIIVYAILPLYKQPFFEQDPNLSYPYAEQEVSIPLLYAYCAIPAFLAFFWVMAHPVTNADDPGGWGWVRRAQMVACVFTQSSVTFFATHMLLTLLKKSIGEPRPNLFAYCDYQGYREAIATNDFQLYHNLTSSGTPGRIELCRIQNVVDDAFMSWPSGHAALIFASVTSSVIYVTMMRRQLLRGVRNRCALLNRFVAICLFALATYISISRVQDNFHRSYDIFAGMLLGTISGLACSYLFFDSCPVPGNLEVDRFLSEPLNG